MKSIKCECGHVNPEGTVLCEACGKPIEGNQHIDGNDKKKLLNMRYDGTARRSQTYNKSIIDKIWSFFSSVKVGVWLIVLALIASAIGTIFPQQQYIPIDAISRDPAIYYPETYGILGQIYYQLGLHNLFSSWWYLILIALIGVSLVICSLDRFVPLYKALKIQKAKRHKTFLSRQRLYSESDEVSEKEKEQVIQNLKKQRYKVRIEDGHVLAEKGRFSRWGPYVNHIGLIIILLAALLRSTPMFYTNEYVWVREGEQIVIPGTDREYFIENKGFILDVYDENDERFKDAIQKEGRIIPSNFQTNAVVYKQSDDAVAGSETDLEKVAETEIRMNHPLEFDGYKLYQSGYQLNEFSQMTFEIQEMPEEEGAEVESFGEFTIDLINPQSEYELDNGFTVVIDEYFPDYFLDSNGPNTETQHPRNPTFIFNVYPPDTDKYETSFVGDIIGAADSIGIDTNSVELKPMGEVLGMFATNLDATGENEYQVAIKNMDFHRVSGLSVRKDSTLPIFGFGAFIFMFGVIQGMYWQHRRIWIQPTDKGIRLAAHTNKNWFGVKKDIEKVIENTNVKMVEDQQELDE
ncbi:cytochrome c biogenesis protein ResB [Ornithinibacillus halophilus]|uniref:Cytochrome c biogenesis protein n=1 Tax=Ornithinibacillus halophilus TaxID=930117 RepID=A0A1M5CSV0_9BACI|nr:cytochrome c biogenesis protein ResB [Ornithinibacillus halophilus]SHF57834.1 cytochrome c biogenesis protein [Ornithinibacillus halophilus]